MILNNYLNGLKSIIESLTGKGEEFSFGRSFSNLLSVIGYTFAILAILGFIVVMIYFTFAMPKKVYKVVTNIETEIGEVYAIEHKESKDKEEILKRLYKKLKLYKGIFLGALILVYIPIAIPTVLFILDLVLGIIK